MNTKHIYLFIVSFILAGCASTSWKQECQRSAETTVGMEFVAAQPLFVFLSPEGIPAVTPPHTFSAIPKSMDQYLEDPEYWSKYHKIGNTATYAIIGVIPERTRITIDKIAPSKMWGIGYFYDISGHTPWAYRQHKTLNFDLCFNDLFLQPGSYPKPKDGVLVPYCPR